MRFSKLPVSAAVLFSRRALHSSPRTCDIIGQSYRPAPEKPEKRRSLGDRLFQHHWRRPKPVEDGGKPDEDWVSAGFNRYDQNKDWFHLHWTSFLLVSVLSCWYMIFLMYRPDYPQYHEWALREAHLELARREANGLPYISPDYVARDAVLATLPSDEELGDMEIVI